MLCNQPLRWCEGRCNGLLIQQMSSASPGGVHVSSAKKRRLAALDAASKATTGTNRVRETPLSPTDQGKQPRLQPARPGHSLVAAAADAGRASQQEACELQYATLAQSVANGPVLKSLMHAPGLQPAGLQASFSVDMLLESVVRTNPRAADARTAIASRVHNKVFLLENPTAALSTKPKRGKHNKQVSTQLLSRKQRPALGSNHKYSDFAPLHKLWQQYMDELLKSCKDREARILAADFHGCSLQVTRAVNTAHVGLTGIVIKDTAATFTILTQADHVHYIPKRGSVFCFSVDDSTMVTLIGTGLQRERSKG
ncbi:hypothetical protein ABBQ38_004111 [Trebouxia sp. C0009 RCD-2024]